MPRILIAEDDAAMRTMLSRTLENIGYNVTEAQNGIEALDILKTQGPYALLLTDIVMPGMDGLELSTKVRKIFPKLGIFHVYFQVRRFDRLFFIKTSCTERLRLSLFRIEITPTFKLHT